MYIFTMNGKARTTIDGKYSIIKEKDPNGELTPQS